MMNKLYTDNVAMKKKNVLVKKVTYLRWVPLYVFFIITFLSFWIGKNFEPETQINTQLLDVKKDSIGRMYYIERGKKQFPQFVLKSESILYANDHSDTELIEYVKVENNGQIEYSRVSLK